MERTEYLRLCREISTLPSLAGGIIKRVPPELLVEVGDSTYYPFYFEMKFRNGEPRDVAVLHDLRANSLLHCELEKVRRKL